MNECDDATPTTLPQIKISHPFPQQLRKKNDNVKFQKCVEIIKVMKVNVSLVDSLTKILGYDKYMKELAIKRRG